MYLCLTSTAHNLRDKPKPSHCATCAAKRTTAVTALVFIVSARSNKDTLITTQRACQSQRALDAVLDSFPWTPFNDDAFYLFLQRRLLPPASSSAAHARNHPQCRPPAAIAPFGISALQRARPAPPVVRQAHLRDPAKQREKLAQLSSAGAGGRVRQKTSSFMNIKSKT
jgi:hypothetical protein